MQHLRARLSRLEATSLRAPSHRIRRYVVDAPHGLPNEDVIAFLRSCGHEISDEAFSIIRTIVGAQNGKPVDLPMKDRTSELCIGSSLMETAN